MNLESIIWCEVSQKEKNKYYILSYIIYMESKNMMQMNLFAGEE